MIINFKPHKINQSAYELTQTAVLIKNIYILMSICMLIIDYIIELKHAFIVMYDVIQCKYDNSRQPSTSSHFTQIWSWELFIY